MPRTKVTFPANIPTQVILNTLGDLQASASGEDEYRYFLDPDQIMWVPPNVHQAIHAEPIGAGDAITITRHKRGKEAATWTVEHDSQAERAQAKAHGYSHAPSPTAPPQRQPAAQAPPARPLASAPQRTAPQPAVGLADELPITAADRMAGALRDAIDLTRGARQYEPSIQWTAADVRAIAATLFIAAEKGGQR